MSSFYNSESSVPFTILLQTDNNIFWTELERGHKTYLTFDGNDQNRYMFPSWSHNNCKIVYTNIKSGGISTGGGLLLASGSIWTMNADGTEQKQITPHEMQGSLPSFSPDRKSILFTNTTTGNPELWRMDVDGSHSYALTYTTGSGIAKDGKEVKWSSHGSFSPDGTKIAYSSTQSGQTQIWIMNSDGSNQHQITFADDPNAPDANNPTWSSDGQKIVYFGGFERVGGHIYTINPDGSDRTRLTYMPSDDPSWSPDGQQIYFDAARPDNSGADAWIMNRDGSDQRILSSTPLYPVRMPATTVFQDITVSDPILTEPVELSSAWIDEFTLWKSSDSPLTTELNYTWNDCGGGE